MNPTAKMNLDVYYCPINAKLKAYCLEGIIPGPDESLDSYLIRAKNLATPDFDLSEHKDVNVKEALQSIFNIYGVSQIKVKIFRSNKNLLPWEGGVTWIWDQGVSIQLPSHKRIFSAANYSEIITHELVHVMRQKFNEPMFEEFIAYQSSPKYWRRILGPFLARSRHCLLLLGSFVLGQVIDWLSLSWHWTSLAVALIALPLACLTGRRHYQYQKAKKNVASAFCPSIGNFIMLFLTDREIIKFSRSKKSAILKYLNGHEDLRVRCMSLFLL